MKDAGGADAQDSRSGYSSRWRCWYAGGRLWRSPDPLTRRPGATSGRGPVRCVRGSEHPGGSACLRSPQC